VPPASNTDQKGLIAGLILSRQWRESKDGLELIFWFASEAGPLRIRLLNQEAVCFFPTRQQDQLIAALSKHCGQNHWRVSPTQLKNFSHENMSALYFNSQRRLYDCRDRLRADGIDLVEADIKPTDRYLMERFITGAAEISGAIDPGDKFSQLSEAKLTTVDYRPELNAVSIDIETDYTAETLYSIALYSNRESTVFIIGERHDAEVHSSLEAELSLVYCRNEREVILQFLDRIRLLDPDLIMGWNIVNFDLRCLQKFSDRLKIKFNLGRNDEAIIWRNTRENRDRFYALVPGRVVLDGIELMRSATYQFENFSLEYVARKILNRGKLVEDVDQRGEEITHLFNEDKPALARYNLEDCRLVWDIFEKENLLDFAIERSLLTGLELDRYGGSVAAFDFLYLPRLHRKGFVAPSLAGSTVSNISPGGHVMESIPGIHENVILLDFKSLYPSIVRTFHVDPLALAIGLREENPIQGYDEGLFSRTEYILPELIETLWLARDRAKAKGNAVLSQAIKIIMNSFYGVLGTQGCRFLDSRLVSSITKRGHEIMIESKKFIESKGYKVIYGDTDSVFVLLGPMKSEKVAEIGRGLTEQLNCWWSEQLAEKYQVESRLEMEFETHFSRFLMPTVRGSDAGSKKRYAGLIADSSLACGYRILFKGLESVRSDWSPLARNFQQVLYERIFLEQPYREYVKLTIEELLAGKYEDELVLRKRLRRKLADYVKNVPPHVQAARKAEEIRSKRNLPSLYRSGGWIEYIITVNGPEPRQYRQSAIDYDFYIEKQLTPIADSILVFQSSSMNDILNKQIGLF